jgi:hypothetical protein
LRGAGGPLAQNCIRVSHPAADAATWIGHKERQIRAAALDLAGMPDTATLASSEPASAARGDA